MTSYIDLLNDFNQWLESNALPCSSQLMYFRLLNVFNRAGWPEYVQVDNLRMMIMTGVESTHAIVRARDKLVEAGFITFQKGKKGCPNRYYLKKQCKNVTVSVTENVTKSDTISVTESVTTNGTHIKTKTKTKTKNNTPDTPNGVSAPSQGAARTQKRFTPPTVEEVDAYCRERGNNVDAEMFVDFYTSKDWMVGKDRMRDWKASVRTWEHRRKDAGSASGWTGKPTKAQELDDFYAMVGEWTNTPEGGETHG